jgi:hypothetical protein
MHCFDDGAAVFAKFEVCKMRYQHIAFLYFSLVIRSCTGANREGLAHSKQMKQKEYP